MSPTECPPITAIKHIYPTEEEREALKRKAALLRNEFVRYANECRPDIQHASLSDAMECFGIEWEGTAYIHCGYIRLPQGLGQAVP